MGWLLYASQVVHVSLCDEEIREKTCRTNFVFVWFCTSILHVNYGIGHLFTLASNSLYDWWAKTLFQTSSWLHSTLDNKAIFFIYTMYWIRTPFFPPPPDCALSGCTYKVARNGVEMGLCILNIIPFYSRQTTVYIDVWEFSRCL
jgi:hypothetical protein